MKNTESLNGLELIESQVLRHVSTIQRAAGDALARLTVLPICKGRKDTSVRGITGWRRVLRVHRAHTGLKNSQKPLIDGPLK